jgi:hypothetical protein
VATYSGLVSVTPDDQLDLREIEKPLATVVKEVRTALNCVRYTMNNFVSSVGCYVKPLAKQAKAVVTQMGDGCVDVGDTDSKIPLATGYIEKVEPRAVSAKKREPSAADSSRYATAGLSN